jgi:hypothetical protein
MLQVLGNSKRCCDGLTRRSFLEAGASRVLGLGVGHWLAGARTNAADRLERRPARGDSRQGFGRADSLIVLCLYSAPSQMDTLDPKSDAPAEVRGEFGSIATRVPGVRLCEHLPRVAGVLDRVTPCAQ